MTSPAVSRCSTTKTVRHLEKPKPLKSTTFSSARHSAPDVPGRLVVNVLEEVMETVECLANMIVSKNYTEISSYTSILSTKLRLFGIQLEDFYKDKLDRAFIAFRDASKDEKIDLNSRVNLLELVELRAMKWQANGSFSLYYSTKGHKSDISDSDPLMTTQPNSAVLHLAPGEVIKPSGKYSSPTKMAGKNYCKDEIVIRNSDSGKVSPGAKERLVQITGPNEDKIVLACNLIEDTIKRNASPVREISDKDHQIGSSSSLNSSASDDNINFNHSASENLFLSSTNESNADTINYRYSFHVGSSNLFLVSDDFNLITHARLFLEERLNGADKPSFNSNDREKFVDSVEVGIQCNENDLPNNNSKGVNILNNSFQTSQDLHRSLRKVKSIFENEPTSPTRISTSPSYLKDGGPKREYTRNFLLSFADCPIARAKPRNWERIAAEFPNLISELRHFELSVYLRKWKELEGKNIVIPSGEMSSDTD